MAKTAQNKEEYNLSFKDGSIVQQGNHNTLKNQKGEYTRMFRRQLKDDQNKAT